MQIAPLTGMYSESDVLESNVRQHTQSAASLQRRLNAWNRARLSPTLPGADWRERVVDDVALLLLEGEFVEQERRAVSERAASAPADPDAFVAWFEALKDTGPGQDRKSTRLN